jgi:hypothetical protein
MLQKTCKFQGAFPKHFELLLNTADFNFNFLIFFQFCDVAESGNHP